MAVLQISEFQNAVSLVGTTIAQMLAQPAITDQVVAVGMASAPSAPFNVKTKVVELNCDVACSILFGPANGGAPVATNANNRMSAGETRRYAVSPCQQVAVIANP